MSEKELMEPEGTPISVEERTRRLGGLIRGYGISGVAESLVIFNILVLFCRPQDTIQPLGASKLAVVLFLSCFCLFVPRWHLVVGWSTTAILWFFGYCAVMIVLGKVVFDNLIVNDGRAFFAFRDLIQYYFCFFFPLAVYLVSGRGIRRFHRALIFCGIYLGAFGLSHAGTGPGGFLGDENDLCLVLDVLLPFCIAFFPVTKTLIGRASCVAAFAVCLAGIVATQSRGGFVGLLLMLLFFWWRSRYKIQITLLLAVLIGGAIPFVPTDYWKDMSTITHVDEGTAMDRRILWGTVRKMWLTPENFLTGVGLDNAPWRLVDYQDAEFGVTKRSLAGRAIHSLYFEVIGDLGMVGIVFIGFLVGNSYLRNERTRKLLRRAHAVLEHRVGEIQTEVSASLRLALDECIYMENALVALSSAWLALLGAGAFISVLYYPTIWLLVVLSLMYEKYALAVARESHELLIQSASVRVTVHEENKEALQLKAIETRHNTT